MKQYTYDELNEMRLSKGELFMNLEGTFDYALPQTWLDDFSSWCKVNFPVITYHLISSTTVWYYSARYFSGHAMTVCKDVQDALDHYRGI